MPISPESQKPSQNIQTGQLEDSSKNSKKKRGRKKHVSREVEALPEEQGASKVAVKGISQGASDASPEGRTLVKRSESNPKVLAPGSRKVLPPDEVASRAGELDSLYAEIQRRVTEMKDIMPKVLVSCDLQGYKVTPDNVQETLASLENMIDQYQTLLWETYPSIRASAGSDQNMLQFVERFGAETVFSKDVKSIHEMGTKKTIEEKFWRGVLLQDVLFDFKFKRMEANFYVTMAIRNLVESGASMKVASQGYQRFMSDNLAFLQQLYQSIHAREKLGIANEPTGQKFTEFAVKCGQHLMMQVHGALNHFHQAEETHAVNDLVTPCKESLMRWLDGFDIKRFREPAYARRHSQLPLDLVIGYSLLGEQQKALETVRELRSMMPEVTLGENLPFMLAYELLCLSEGMVFWSGEFNKDLQKATEFQELLVAFQGLMNQAEESGQLPAGDHYKITGQIKSITDNVHQWLSIFHKAEKIASDNAQSLIDQQQNERHQLMLKRLRHTRKLSRPARAVVARQPAEPVDTPEKPEPGQSHKDVKVDPDIEQAMHYYRAGLPLSQVARHLKTVEARGDVNTVAMARYALVDIVQDHIEWQLAGLKQDDYFIEQYEQLLAGRQLPGGNYDKHFRNVMESHAGRADSLIKDLLRAQLGLKAFSDYCMEHDGVVDELADQVVCIHEKMSAQLNESLEVSEHFKRLNDMYRLRGVVLRAQGKFGGGPSERALKMAEQSRSLESAKNKVSGYCGAFQSFLKGDSYKKAQAFVERERAEIPASRPSMVSTEEDDAVAADSGATDRAQVTSMHTVSPLSETSAASGGRTLEQVIPSELLSQIVQFCSEAEQNKLLSLLWPFRHSTVNLECWMPESRSESRGETHPVNMLANVTEKPVVLNTGLQQMLVLPNEEKQLGARTSREAPSAIPKNSIRLVLTEPVAPVSAPAPVPSPSPAPAPAPATPASIGHRIPDDVMKALCWSLKKSEKTWGVDHNGLQLVETERGERRKGKGKKKTKTKPKTVASTHLDADIEGVFHRYIKGFVEKGKQRSGQSLPESVKHRDWLQRCRERRLFGLSHYCSSNSQWGEGFQGAEGTLDVSEIGVDFMFLADALNMPVKVEYTATESRLYQPGIWQTLPYDTGAHQEEPVLTLTACSDKWYASLNHCFEEG